ncbi:MAG: Fe-S cluster assembly protein SufD [Leptolyngbyaceae cyanobacterium]
MTTQVSTLAEVGTSPLSARVDRSAYLLHLLALRSPLPPELSWFEATREQAAARLQELAIPSTREEAWRFTDLSPLLQVAFVEAEPASVSLADLEPFLLPEARHSRLVFIDGVYAPTLSATSDLPQEIFVGSVRQAHASIQSKLATYLGKQAGGSELFTSLNTASFTDAAVIWVPQGQMVEVPIQLLSISTAIDTPRLNQPRCLVVAESSSSITLIETYANLGDGAYFTNPVTEIWVESNAQVNHSRVQQDGSAAFHIGKTAVSVDRDGRYDNQSISLGGANDSVARSAIARHHLEVWQLGEQTEIVINGLTLLEGEQLSDTHSEIVYAKPYGTSRQVHKCIVDDRAHAVFNGRICVPKLAQLTHAEQLSKSLLLSPRARVDTKPQLEIVADNVKCSHGATVSQLENDEVFYLQSRGIDQETARKLLVFAFAAEVIDQIPIPSLRDRLSAYVRAHQ